MLATYKVMSALLSYPDAVLQRAAPDLIDAVDKDGFLPIKERAALVNLITQIAESDLLDAQADYVELFDRTRALSLHLFEHVHGESRDRGQAMVSLRDRYRQAGIDIAANELPDFIPMFLEFLSLQTAAEARAMLAVTAPILTALADRLKKRGSLYAAPFDCLVALCQIVPDSDALAQLQETDIENPNDLQALDRAWEETEVRFGPGDAANDGCPRAADIVRKFEKPGEQARSAP